MFLLHLCYMLYTINQSNLLMKSEPCAGGARGCELGKGKSKKPLGRGIDKHRCNYTKSKFCIIEGSKNGRISRFAAIFGAA